MILKKFLGKTIEAAKRSARQMYGDDFVVLGSSPANEEHDAGITIAVDNKHARESNSTQREPKPGVRKNGSNGVHYESSGDYKGGGTRYKPTPVSTNLMALRQYAEKLNQANNYESFDEKLKAASDQHHNSGNEPKSDVDVTPEKSADTSTPKQVYSRANVRSAAKESKPEKKSIEPKNGLGLLNQFEQSRPKFIERTSTPVSTERREQREITALHKRFDKLEALLDSALISSNINYVSHPAFQQLIHTGISSTVVSGWFSDIVRQGVDPFEQPETFMSKLSAIIRDALTFKTPSEIKKYMLFTGPSGSGKTQLIMKLMMHPEHFKNKKVAVVAFLPREKQEQNYYTILEPFCMDNSIPYFGITSGNEVTSLQEQWEEYDHILIDTPSISMQQESSFREYWKIRQVFASVTPLEVHYVVNASLNSYYFKDSSAVHHPLHPDYIAITHLDEVSQWGPVIPFLKEMGCGARYISAGDSIPDSLSEFNPTWFAQHVLQKT